MTERAGDSSAAGQRPARHVLVGVGGGIAAFKVAALVSRLVQDGLPVRVAMSRDAHHFVGVKTFAGLTGRAVIERSTQTDPDGTVPHIEATRHAGLYVIAPATADLLARLAAGVCDDAVTLAAVACTCPVLLCPAMNDAMWRDAAVQRNVAELEARGVTRLGPVEGHLAEGYAAIGRMVEFEDIARAVHERWAAAE